MKTPCKDCTRREMGCHSKCSDYIQYTEQRAAYLAKYRMEQSAAVALGQAAEKRRQSILKNNRERAWH